MDAAALDRLQPLFSRPASPAGVPTPPMPGTPAQSVSSGRSALDDPGAPAGIEPAIADANADRTTNKKRKSSPKEPKEVS